MDELSDLYNLGVTKSDTVKCNITSVVFAYVFQTTNFELVGSFYAVKVL